VPLSCAARLSRLIPCLILNLFAGSDVFSFESDSSASQAGLLTRTLEMYTIVYEGMVLMVRISCNDESLKRHGITYVQVQEAITDPIRAQFEVDEPSLAGNYREILVGHTYANVLLEIGLEMIGQDKLYIFHAQKISPKVRLKYEEWLKNA
jgi:uncharacterized DUF497 family protein